MSYNLREAYNYMNLEQMILGHHSAAYAAVSVHAGF